jgi:cellulose synthase operon protein C
MMCSRRASLLIGAAILAACSSGPQKGTLATLHKVAPDLQDVKVEGGLDTAMHSYQRFLEETPETQRTPEAMRRLADLKIEKEYGLNGTGELLELPAPQAADLPDGNAAATAKPMASIGVAAVGSEQEIEQRANEQQRVASAQDMLQGQLPQAVTDDLARAGPLEAIQL